MTPLERITTAYHEAGHAVAFVHFDIPFAYVSVLLDPAPGEPRGLVHALAHRCSPLHQAAGSLAGPCAEAAYTGEETFPLHPLAVQAAPATHTLLFGYLPIGGGDFVPPAPLTLPAADTSDLPEDLPWPFGLADRSNGAPATYGFDQQITSGQIASQLCALLRVLLGRYQFATLFAYHFYYSWLSGDC